MSASSQRRSEEFLQISGQFKLGALVTESSHPVTANLSEVAKTDIAAALGLLFEADGDVVKKFREFAASGRAGKIAAVILNSIKSGGKIFFTGCGSTGRLSILLDSIWRDFWQRQKNPGFENRTFSVMAGGDYALIKSVEGFEDFTAFGEKQIADLSLSSKDVVFAITEGGETSFVIGTAWAGVKAGAKVYFVYNNPDDILCKHVARSREVIQDARIEKINLTTGPMSITGSTRMQATSIQLCVMLTVLEIVARELVAGWGERPREPLPPKVQSGSRGRSPHHKTDCLDASVPMQFLAQLETLHSNLRAPEFLASLAKLVALEESVYRSGGKNNYFADYFGADVLTDTTERSPTYCTPPFRKFDDTTATESWSYLFLPEPDAASAWRSILKREPRCVKWSEAEIRALVSGEKFQRTSEIINKISATELMRFRIGLDGVKNRPLGKGDSAIAVLSETEIAIFNPPKNFFNSQLETARKAGAQTAMIYFGAEKLKTQNSKLKIIFVPLPQNNFLLNGVTRVAVKLVVNALSTCTMVRLGRVMGNYMVWVVPSNLKLIDRATRYISKLTNLPYERANALLFEIIEYVEPRMKADQAYPPVVGMAVVRAKNEFTNEQAESFLQSQ
jgi:N-acetylmuramic acid 6-phosphate etherase